MATSSLNFVTSISPWTRSSRADRTVSFPRRRLTAPNLSPARPLTTTMQTISAEASIAGPNPVFAQTMLRIKDPVKTRTFYEEHLGMTFLTKLDFPDLKFSLLFFAYTDEAPIDPSAPQPTRARWLWSRRYPTVECTHNWGTESDPAFTHHNGNTEPKGFGHLGLTLNSITDACARLASRGVPVVRKPGPFKDVGSIAFVADPDGYWIELIQRPTPSSGPDAGLLGPDPVFAQTMLRVKDAAKSVAFYERLGMRLVTKFDFPDLEFSLYFLAYAEGAGAEAEAEAVQGDRAKWLWGRRYPTLELTYNYGTEKNAEFGYHNGNTDPRGFGHVGVIVGDIYATAEGMEKSGAMVVRKPGPFKDVADIAFVADPDGYWVELIARDGEPAAVPYSK